MTRSKWTKEIVARIAIKYKNREQFRRDDCGAYKWAYRNNLMDEVCAHMDPQFRWGLETVRKEAAQYETRADFMRGSSSAYQWWVRNGKPGGVCDHMRLQKRALNEQTVREDAKQYGSRNAFCLGSPGSYNWANARGLLDDVCGHMVELNKPVSIDEARAAAAGCKTRGEFYHKQPRCYAWALRRGVLDQICGHMVAGDNVSDKNVLYIAAPEGMPLVRKIGITSARSGKSRIRAVEKSLGRRCKVEMFPREDAADVERELLAMGSPVDLPAHVAGRTEFRRFSDAELIACETIARTTA